MSDPRFICERCNRRFNWDTLVRSRYWPIKRPFRYCRPCYELLMSSDPATTGKERP